MGPNGGDFPIASNSCAGAVPSGSTCKVVVSFSPTMPGGRAAALQFTVGDTAQSIALAGFGLAANSTLTVPTAVDCGVTVVSDASTPQNISITAGSAPVTLSNFALAGANPGEFKIASNSCPPVLLADGSCDLGITFAPAATGVRTATLQISDSATGSPQNVLLSGVGESSAASLTTPLAVNIGETAPGYPASGNVSVQNGGAVPVAITATDITGTNASDFTVVTSCPTIGAFQSCSLSVAFNPAGAGVRAASLLLTDNASGSPQKITLTGFGLPKTMELIVSPSVDFSPTSIGTTTHQALKLMNAGTATVHVKTAELGGVESGDFTASSNQCSQILPGAECALQLNFSPTATGLRKATLTVTDDASGTPQYVALTGVCPN